MDKAPFKMPEPLIDTGTALREWLAKQTQSVAPAPPYVPTPEELAGETWQHCYGQPVIIPPPMEEESNEHHL